jgi:hypothetical protein
LSEDWHAAYSWTKGWIGQGGGAWLPEAWLSYAASALLNGQPRIAVRSIDLGLGNWIADELDRAILLWARGSVVMRSLSDPKTALADLQAAGRGSPEWLRAKIADDIVLCESAAVVSRKRKPSVEGAPTLGTKRTAHDKVAGPVPRHKPGACPPLWDALVGLLAPAAR